MKLGNVEVDFSFTNTSNLRRLQEAYKKVLDEDNKSKKKTLYVFSGNKKSLWKKRIQKSFKIFT